MCLVLRTVVAVRFPRGPWNCPAGRSNPDAAATTQQQLADLYRINGLHLVATPELKTKVVLDHFSTTRPTP